ncbi:hypothetical protein Bbelb_402610 [Branchiostoma belcheri]|nr:hypothetical protein Bbelb_402610 [Branchiostoma belcheri]
MPILLEKEKTFTPFALGCLKQTHVERTDLGSPREESSYGIRGPISQGLRGAPLRYQLTMLAPNRASPVVGNSVAPLKSESDDVIWARQSPVHSGHRHMKKIRKRALYDRFAISPPNIYLETKELSCYSVGSAGLTRVSTFQRCRSVALPFEEAAHLLLWEFVLLVFGLPVKTDVPPRLPVRFYPDRTTS